MTDGDPRLEHIAGPTLRRALLCGRCGMVLATVLPAVEEGTRVVSSGMEIAVPIGGEWPFARCEPWHPEVGQRPGNNPPPPRPGPYPDQVITDEPWPRP